MNISSGEYRWLTDESESASGDEIVFADESEYIDGDEGDGPERFD